MPKRLISWGQRYPWLSHRGTVLALYGVVMAFFGLALLIAPTSAQLKNATYAFHLMGVTAWGWVWVGVGASSFLGAWFVFDRWFFALGAALWSIWTLFYVFSWINGYSVGPVWLSAIIYGAFAMILVRVAGWPDVKPIRKIRWKGRRDRVPRGNA